MSGVGRREARLVVVAGSALWSCALDFSIAGRQFECPPDVTGCLACNPDGTCRELDARVEPVAPGRPPERPEPSESELDAGAPEDASSVADGGSVEPPRPPDPPPPEPPDVGEPSPPEPCAEFASRASDSLCLEGNTRCFSLGSVLSPSLSAWLDPTTLPRDGSRHWCDRSGSGHHALLHAEGDAARVESDGRAAGSTLSRSLTLDGAWLSLDEGGEQVLRPGNFAVLVAAATPLDAPDRAAFGLFESGGDSKISLTIEPDGSASGSISSTETALVPDPVVTRSAVFDKRFHLYSLYRRSEVRVLDDVLQLRLNGVLEFRGSSIAIPRALDLSLEPHFGRSDSTRATGRGRVAAIVVLRGSVPEDELARLETFLCQELAACAPPVEPPSSEPDGDAGS
ncbi:MAG TPA: hypothetical protein VNN80_05895 [Polyangiaceae bacterium]|nr:hypothetical protein [Polyangiaceae bacterium]